MNRVIPSRVSAALFVRTQAGAALDAATAAWLDGAAAHIGLGTATDLEIGGAGVRGGRVQLSHDPGTGRFRAVAEYESPAPLGDAGLELLKARTYGDWHDGVGGSFFERLGESLGVDVTVSVVGELEVEQRPVASAQLGPGRNW